MPARLHLAVKLGRRWLCLNCFCMEAGGVEAFRRARCVGEAQVAEAPRSFLTDLSLAVSKVSPFLAFT